MYHVSTPHTHAQKHTRTHTGNKFCMHTYDNSHEKKKSSIQRECGVSLDKLQQMDGSESTIMMLFLLVIEVVTDVQRTSRCMHACIRMYEKNGTM